MNVAMENIQTPATLVGAFFAAQGGLYIVVGFIPKACTREEGRGTTLQAYGCRCGRDLTKRMPPLGKADIRGQKSLVKIGHMANGHEGKREIKCEGRCTMKKRYRQQNPVEV